MKEWWVDNKRIHEKISENTASFSYCNRSDSAGPLPELGSEVETMGRGQGVEGWEKPAEKKKVTPQEHSSVHPCLFVFPLFPPILSHFPLPQPTCWYDSVLYFPFPPAAVAMTTGGAWPLCHLSDVEVCPRHHPVPTSGGGWIWGWNCSQRSLWGQRMCEDGMRVVFCCCVVSLGMISKNSFFFMFSVPPPPHLLQLLVM